MTTSNDGYKNRAAALKRLGVVTYDLRGKLTSGQKSHITKKYEEYKHYFEKPEQFAVRYISNKSAKAYAQSGYKVIKRAKKSKLIMPIPEGAKLHIKGKKAIIETANREMEFVVSEKKRLFEDLFEYEKKPLKPGEFLTIRIGESNPINRKFDGSAKMLNYIQAKNTGAIYNGRPIPKWHNDDAIRHIVIVRITDIARPATKGNQPKGIGAKKPTAKKPGRKGAKK